MLVRKQKRWYSLFLCMILVFGMMPVNAYAEGGNEFPVDEIVTDDEENAEEADESISDAKENVDEPEAEEVILDAEESVDEPEVDESVTDEEESADEPEEAEATADASDITAYSADEIVVESSNEFTVATAEEFVDAVNTINAADSGDFIIRLSADIRLNGDYSFTKNITTILGEGYTISGGWNKTLQVTSGATLNLGASDYEKELTVTGGSTGPLVSASKATVNMYDHVTLKENSVYGSPGGVQLEDESTMNMYGGNITDCHSPIAYGGGILVAKDCTLNMSGGTISGCSAIWGGGIYDKSGTVNISSGTITENTATYGGGLAILYAKTGWYPRNFIITKAEITNNTAELGGGILLYNSSTASTVQNCTITGNKATAGTKYQIGGGIVLMENSSADFTGEGNIVCNNVAGKGAADVYVNNEDQGSSIKLPDAAAMDQIYQQSGQTIDGWYTDGSDRYEPAEDAVPVDVSKQLKSDANTDFALIASYKLKSQVSVAYDLNGGKGAEGIDYSDELYRIGDKVTVKAAPSRQDYLFNGWSDGSNSYQAGDTFIISNATILTANWTKISEWAEKKLEVNVDVNVSVDVSQKADAKLAAGSEEILSTFANQTIMNVLNGSDTETLGADASQQLRNLINSNPDGSVKVVLTISAQLMGEKLDNADEQALLEKELKEGEDVQIWELSILMDAASYDAAGTEILGKMDSVSIHSLKDPVIFELSTGKDFTGKEVRVLYLHENQVKSAKANITKERGIVELYANEFSPYVILSKAEEQPTEPVKPSEPTTPSEPAKPTDPATPAEPTTPTDPIEPTTPAKHKKKHKSGETVISQESDASAMNTVTTTDAASTGDDSALGRWLLLFMVSGTAVTIFLKKRKWNIDKK